METKTPREYAEAKLQEAYDIAALGERLMQIQREKCAIWPKFRQEAKSNVDADRNWENSPLGLEEKEIRIKIKVKEHKISAISSYLRVLENESRNQY